MSQVKPQPIGEASWNDDKCLAKIRKRISIVSRRNRLIRFMTILLIIALGIGIVKEVAFWVTTLYR